MGGRIFGEIAFDEAAVGVSHHLDACKMLVVSREDLVNVVKSSPAFALHFINHLHRGASGTLTTTCAPRVDGRFMAAWRDSSSTVP